MDANMADNTRRNIRKCLRKPRRPNSPYRFETETLKRPGRWRHVSDEESNVYAPRNMSIEALIVVGVIVAVVDAGHGGGHRGHLQECY